MMGDNDPNNSGINSSNNGGMTHQMGSSSGIPTSGSLGGINSSNIINNNNGMVGGSGLPVAGGGLNLGMGVVGMQNPHGGYDPSMVAGGSVVGMQQQQQQQQQGIPGGMQFYQAPPNSLPSTALQALNDHWQKHYHEIDNTKDFKTHELPLARIKKIMKSDEDVKQMISAEAPILFAKACELFIYELTARSWIHTQESKRRTLQKNDIAVAISRTDIFDFLIDIVPREEAKPTTAPGTGNLTANMGTPNSEERGNANNNNAGIQTGVVNQANAQPQLDLQQFLLFHQLNQQQQQGLRPDMSSMLQSPQQQQAANNRQQIPILDQQMYLYLMQQQYMQALQQQPQGTQQQQQGNAEDEYTQNTDNTGDASGVVPNIQSSTDASGVNSTTTLQHGTRPMMGQQQYNPQQYTDNSGSQQDQQVEGGEGTSADQQQGQAYRSF